MYSSEQRQTAFNYPFVHFMWNKFTKTKHQLFKIPLDKQVCHENLAIIHRVFSDHKIFFWLSEGTALGWRRGYDFIDWDDDVDIGIWDSDYSKLLSAMPILKQEGFSLVEARSDDTFFSFIRRGEKIDIDVTGKGRVCTANWENSCDLLLPELQKFNKVYIRGLEYNIPGDGYLRALYGDWKIPKKTKK